MSPISLVHTALQWLPGKTEQLFISFLHICRLNAAVPKLCRSVSVMVHCTSAWLGHSTGIWCYTTPDVAAMEFARGDAHVVCRCPVKQGLCNVWEPEREMETPEGGSAASRLKAAASTLPWVSSLLAYPAKCQLACFR